MKIVLSPRAGGDLERLKLFLAENDTGAADSAIALLRDRIGLLGQFPGLGRRIGRTDLHELYAPFGNSAYVIRYHHSRSRETVAILRIWHGREHRS
jgi:toxin ParE1/3/4